MAAGMAIVGGIRAAGAVKGYRDERKAATNQRDIDNQNIERQIKENAETVRRTEESQRAGLATASTAAAGSGFATDKPGGVKARYLEGLKGLYKSDLDWLKESQKSGVDIAQTETGQRYSAARNRGTTKLISGLGGAGGAAVGSYGRFQKVGNWWD